MWIRHLLDIFIGLTEIVSSFFINLWEITLQRGGFGVIWWYKVEQSG